VVVCASCATANAPTYKFCKRCGQGLEVGTGTSSEAIAFALPSSYTPKHLAEKILTSKGALEGERK
jgi:hypothetical protein